MISSSNKSYPIPIDCPKEFTYQVECKSAAIGNNIWILHGSYRNDDSPQETIIYEMFIFDCETQDLKKLDIDFPSNFTEHTGFITNCNDQLYIWRYPWSELVDCLRYEDPVEWILFKLDTRTMEWEEIVTIITADMKSYTPIIDSAMYIINGNNDLLKIDLITKNVEHVMELESDHYSELMSDNDKLYIKQDSEEWELGYTITSVFENETVRLLKCDEYVLSRDIAGNNFFKHPGKTVCLDSIDVDTYRVVRRVVDYREEGEKYKWIETVSQIGDTIYAIISVVDYTNRQRFKMCVLSLTPKLWSICMLQLVDQFGDDEEEMERIKEKLPMQLRTVIDEFVEWRIRKNDDEKDLESDFSQSTSSPPSTPPITN